MEKLAATEFECIRFGRFPADFRIVLQCCISSSKPSRPHNILVFRYEGPEYKRYPLVQILAYLLFAVGAVLYFGWFSEYRVAFFHDRRFYGPVAIVLTGFAIPFTLQPVLQLLKGRNERIELAGDLLTSFGRFGRKRFRAHLNEISLVRVGVPVTSRVKRYVFQAGERRFTFSEDISGLDKLLKALRYHES